MRHAFVSFVVLIALATAPTTARAQLLGIDGMMATVLQEGQSSFSGLGFRARVHPTALIPQIEILPTFEFWRNSSSVQPFGIEATRKDATLAVDLRYVLPAAGWEPYFGTGFGLHFLSNKVNAPGLGLNDLSDSAVKGGLALLAGASFGLTERVDNFLELKYHHVSGYRQLKINWGLAYNL